MPKLSVDWPFNPKKVPFFYGWVIWVLSTLGFLMSIPGQTMGMAVFTDPLIDVTGLSRTELSMAYLLGTIGSSLFLTKAGQWYDRYGGRVMIPIASLCLGVMVTFISSVDYLTGLLGGGAFVLMLLGYFGVRFFGQGVLTSCSRNVLISWFAKRRGLVSGLRSLFVSFGFSIAPLLLASLIALYDWRGALWFLAIMVSIYGAIALVFIRDNPASIGVTADGGDLANTHDRVFEVTSKTLREAKRDPIFWIYSASLGFQGLIGTALTFHVVSIFNEAGRNSEEAFGYFLPAAIFSVSANLIASWIVDRYSLKPFLLTKLTLMTIGCCGLLNLNEPWGFWLLAVGWGCSGGLWSVISNLVHIRFFGPLNLGAISGLSTSLTVFASAIGPAAFSLSLDVFGSYSEAIKISIGIVTCLLITAVITPQNEPSPRFES
jgi:OFA family oxalate/formate antiporter-like MFS transporter